MKVVVDSYVEITTLALKTVLLLILNYPFQSVTFLKTDDRHLKHYILSFVLQRKFRRQGSQVNSTFYNKIVIPPPIKMKKAGEGDKTSSSGEVAVVGTRERSLADSVTSLLSLAIRNSNMLVGPSCTTLNRNNNPDFSSDQNGQHDQHSNVHHHHLNDRSNGSGGSSSSPAPLPPPPSSSSLCDSAHSFSSFDSRYALLSAQKLDSFLDQYELKHELEPMVDRDSKLITLIREKICSLYQRVVDEEEEGDAARIDPQNKLQDPFSPSLGLYCCETPGSGPENVSAIKGGEPSKNNNNNTPPPMAPTVNGMSTMSQSSNCSQVPLHSKTVSSAVHSSPNKASNNNGSEVTSSVTVPPPHKPKPHHQDNQQESAKDKVTSWKPTKRINTEVNKRPFEEEEDNKPRFSRGNVRFATPQPPQHIDNSQDALRLRTKVNGSSDHHHPHHHPVLSSPEQTSPPPTSSSSSSSGSLGSDRKASCKSKIPVLLPKTKSKSVKEVEESSQGICCSSSTKSQSQICNKADIPNPNNFAQRGAHHPLKHKAEASQKTQQQANTPETSSRDEFDQVESNPNKNNINNANPSSKSALPTKSSSTRRNIGEGDEIADTLGLIDGLSSHTTWVMSKVLEYPASGMMEPRDRLKTLRKSPDVGYFFDAPYVQGGLMKHLFFSGKLPKCSASSAQKLQT